MCFTSTFVEFIHSCSNPISGNTFYCFGPPVDDICQKFLFFNRKITQYKTCSICRICSIVVLWAADTHSYTYKTVVTQLLLYRFNSIVAS